MGHGRCRMWAGGLPEPSPESTPAAPGGGGVPLLGFVASPGGARQEKQNSFSNPRTPELAPLPPVLSHHYFQCQIRADPANLRDGATREEPCEPQGGSSRPRCHIPCTACSPPPLSAEAAALPEHFHRLFSLSFLSYTPDLCSNLAPAVPCGACQLSQAPRRLSTGGRRASRASKSAASANRLGERLQGSFDPQGN